MGLQLRLVRDGYAARYASPEKPNLPSSVQYDDLAYGVTYEPVVFVHNKRLLPDAPQTHDEFLQLLRDRKNELTGKVATYDIERNAPSFSFAGNDQRHFARFDELAAALGAVGAKRYVATGTLLERIGSGQQLLGYNVAGSAAVTRASKDPDLGVVYPQDYTELASTVMLLVGQARHPNAAKLFLDFALRREGQAALTQANLFAVRDDVDGQATVRALKSMLGDRLKPIALDDSAVQLLEPAQRLALLQAWQGARGAR
jgi:iron(III) transport system substrate-binding protein